MAEIEILKEPISLDEVKKMAQAYFGDMVKAVVDVEQGKMAICAEFHADLEVRLMDEEESKRDNTWGINLYPDETEERWIEFDSMINFKPALGNRSRDVEKPEIRQKIKNIVGKFVKR